MFRSYSHPATYRNLAISYLDSLTPAGRQNPTW